MLGNTGDGNVQTSAANGSAGGSAPLFYPGFCGDGIVNAAAGETCDPNDATTSAGCRTSGPFACTRCGDGILQTGAGETCDGTAGTVGSGCRAAGTTDECTSCGDGVMQPTSGETCDGTAGSVGSGCRSDCTSCGDGVLQAAHNETCDGTAGSVGSGCRTDCTSCGDGVLQAGHNETCDGTAGTVGSGCRTDCTSCGDSVVQASHGETCDPPGSAAGGNGQNCRSDCTVCGDGVIQAADGEQCDDGSPSATCDNQCLPAGCPAGSNACANPDLAGIDDCTILETNGGKVTLMGPPGPVVGDVCVDGSGKLAMSGGVIVTGDVRLETGAGFSFSGSASFGGPVNEGPTGLQDEIDAATAAATSAASKPCTLNLGNLTTAQTINTSGDGDKEYVICVGNVDLGGGKVVTVTGDAGDTYVFKVPSGGKFKLSGGAKIQVDGTNVQPSDILYFVDGTGPDVDLSGGSSIDGSLLALQRKVVLKAVIVNGQVVSAKDIVIMSGTSVGCPCPTQ
jgi:choice-of-anchor A domain-containing protein